MTREMPKEIVATLSIPRQRPMSIRDCIKFANERNTRWEYIPPANVVPLFDKRSTAVREIMSKAGILKETK